MTAATSRTGEGKRGPGNRLVQWEEVSGTGLKAWGVLRRVRLGGKSLGPASEQTPGAPTLGAGLRAARPRGAPRAACDARRPRVNGPRRSESYSASGRDNNQESRGNLS